MNKRLAAFESVLAYLFVFLLPSQLALHFWPEYSFVFGFRIDYLAPTVYLTDLLLFGLVAVWILSDAPHFLRIVMKLRWYLVAFLLLALVNTMFSISVAVTFLKWLKICEVILVFLYFRYRKVTKDKYIYKALFFSLVFFSLIGIYQFFFGKTTGLFYFLGERTFTISTPGIAIVRLFGRDFLRSYSTFPHPNAMSGYLIASLVFLFGKGFFRKSLVFFLGVGIILMASLLTFSLATLIAAIAILVLFAFFRNRELFSRFVYEILLLSAIASLLLPLFSRGFFLQSLPLGQKVSGRIDLSYLAGKMISEKPFLGEGLSTFIINSPRFRGVTSYSWLLQPVHNIFLLVFSEVGLVGLLLFILVVYKLFRTLLQSESYQLSLVFLFMILTGIFDHYWLTLQQNFLLFALLTGLALR